MAMVANHHRVLLIPWPESSHPSALSFYRQDGFGLHALVAYGAQGPDAWSIPEPTKRRETCSGHVFFRDCSGLCSGTARGFSCALRQLALLLRLRRPEGYGFRRNLVRQLPRKDFSGPSV